VGGVASARVTVSRKMPGHATLVLYGRAHRFALGVKLQMLGVFLGHWNEGLVLIELGIRVGVVLGGDALQMQPAPRELRGVPGCLSGIVRVDRQRRLDGEAGAAVL